MKKIVIIIVCVLATFQMSAQQPSIPNSDFEQWSSGNLVGWTTKLSGTVNATFMGLNIPIPVNLNFGSQTSDAHTGSSALKLTAKGMDFSSYGMPAFVLPGIAQLGTAGSFSVSLETIQQLAGLDFANFDLDSLPNVDWEELASLRNVLSPGVAFNMVPTAMKVWVKYLPPTDVADTMLIIVGAYKTGQPSMILMGQMPETFGYYASGDRMENWTELTIPISYNPEDMACDSLIIAFVSSSFMNAKTSTELYIDDISFEFDYLSVESTERIAMNLYPNPAADYMVISLDNQSDVYDVTVYDMNGRQIKKLEGLTGNIRLAVDELSAGTYFLKVQQTGNTTVRKFVVE